MIPHDQLAYPHEGNCVACHESRLCNYCGASIRGDHGRCTNGRCGKCHGRQCTGGGETSPGHGYGSNTPPTPRKDMRP